MFQNNDQDCMARVGKEIGVYLYAKGKYKKICKTLNPCINSSYRMKSVFNLQRRINPKLEREIEN